MAYKSKTKQAEASRKHYEAHKDTIKAKSVKVTAAARLRNKHFVKDYLKDHPCVDCGNDNIIVLEFDHVRGEKRSTLCDMIRKCFSLENIQTEIEKCEVRCANCHRIVTHERRLTDKICNNIF